GKGASHRATNAQSGTPNCGPRTVDRRSGHPRAIHHGLRTGSLGGTMIFTELPAGASVFLDANTLLYHFTADAKHGPACTDLVERIERQELVGFTSTHVVSEVAHRLMTIEASIQFGRPFAGIVGWLRKHPADVQKLMQFRQAIQEVPRYQIQVLLI